MKINIINALKEVDLAQKRKLKLKLKLQSSMYQTMCMMIEEIATSMLFA